jgi:hypothetical protein
MWATGAATKNFASDEKSTDKHEASCKSEIQNEFFNRIGQERPVTLAAKRPLKRPLCFESCRIASSYNSA